MAKYRLISLISALAVTGCAGHTPYYTIGAGYKFDEPEIRFWSDPENYRTSSPISARLELGIESDNFRYGISHHSQWFDGWPVNGRNEIHKTEVFVDYVHRFKPIGSN